ncbi:MAG: DUF2325 domain-containing protein [Campylobacteraceae bacterium]|jgi:hypothetical protein|nr:DUF2325 domain-containing protein [Campylobacteraceae bacterium]
MSVLVIGADEINPIRAVLNDLGADEVVHWDARKKSSVNRKIIPQNTQCIVMLTSFLNHNTMKLFKSEAKKRNIPVVCAKRSVSCVYSEYCKVFGLNKDYDCGECQKSF